MNVHDALAEAFVAEGTTAVFGMMGDANMHWLNSLARIGVDIYDVRHEGAGLAMADGMARITGCPAVCTTTSGPGTAQLATTMVVASRARTPLVAFCGDTSISGAFDAQHFDQERFAAAIEAGFVRLTAPEETHECVRAAFQQARDESRPIVLSVPTDIQLVPFTRTTNYVPSSAGADPMRILADPSRVKEAAEIVAASKLPVIFVGRGAVGSDAGAATLRLAERIGALIVTSLHAKGWLADQTPFHGGITGGYGTRTCLQLLSQADCVIAAGTSMSTYSTESGSLFSDARTIHIDTAPDILMGHGVAADCVIHADAREVLEQLDARLEQEGQRIGFHTAEVAEQLGTAWEDNARFELEPGTIDPRLACTELDELVPSEIGLVLGSGQQVRFPTMLMRRPRSYIVAQHHFGCIGQGLTTAIGAVVATGRQPGFVIEGDAGFMMHLAEFETAVRYDLPLLVVVMNDQALGAEFHKSQAIGLDPALTVISTPDLGAVGVALGGRGSLVRSLDDLRAGVAAFLATPGPMLLDVRISKTVLSIPYRRAHYHEDV